MCSQANTGTMDLKDQSRKGSKKHTHETDRIYKQNLQEQDERVVNRLLGKL